MTWPTTDFPDATEIADRLRELAGDARYSALCSVNDLAEATGLGARMNYVRVSANASPSTKVLFIGGVHAREWASPASLVNLVSTMLDAHVNDTSITCGTKTFQAEAVHAIMNNIALYVAPMINPDGYDYSRTNDSSTPLATRNDRGWRKNRRPAPSSLPSGCAAADAIGVDINRNFDVCWDIDTKYIAESNVNSSKSPCEIVYIGSAAESEPETRNVKALLSAINPDYYVDVHMGHLPAILYAWGVEQNHSQPAATPALNPGRVRDGTLAPADPGWNDYQEPINGADVTRMDTIARMMSQAMRDATAANYQFHQASALYPASGTSADYAYARNIGTGRAMTMAFTIESGFHFMPVFSSEFPGIQNEIQAALLVLLQFAAAGTPSSSCHRCG